MTKKERQKLIKAIGMFLDENPDKWIDGMDELCLLAYGREWSEYMHAGEVMSVHDIVAKIQEVNTNGKDKS